MNSNKIFRTIILSTTITLCSCAENSQFSELGASLLSSTGLVTESQAKTAFDAGGKLAKAASPLSDEEEYYLGRGVSAMIFAKYKPSKNSVANSYVNRVGNTLASFSGRPETFGGYHFQILESQEINAVSAPGGFVFITSGFLKVIPDEEALAAVLAHEVAHVALGHGVSAVKKANLTQAAVMLGKEAAESSSSGLTSELTQAFGDSIGDIVETLLTKGYSRSQEYDADEYAVKLLRATGYQEDGLITMLKALESAKEKNQDAGWFATHPDPDDRIDEIEGEVKEAKDTSGAKTRLARYKAATKTL